MHTATCTRTANGHRSSRCNGDVTVYCDALQSRTEGQRAGQISSRHLRVGHVQVPDPKGRTIQHDSTSCEQGTITGTYGRAARKALTYTSAESWLSVVGRAERCVFADRSNRERAVKVPIELGIGPVSAFECRSRLWRRLKLDISFGKLPVKEFVAAEKLLRANINVVGKCMCW